MKELKIYLEIIGLAEDENGNPDAAGLSIGGNMVPEDEYEEKMEEIRQKVTIKDVLWFTGLGMFVEEKDCRFISQEVRKKDGGTMRKILFKGKRVDTGEWVEGFPFPSIPGEELNRMTVFEQYQGGTVVNTYKIDPSTVCQYIGLKDKNGVKIFEGDIVKHYIDCPINEYSLDFGKIFWHNPTQRYLRTSSTFQSDCKELSDKCKYKVIGNIHDKEE